MRKISILFFAFFVILSFSNLTEAKEFTLTDAKYVTSEDILFALIEPKLDKIVRDQYGGKQLSVNPNRIHSAGLVRNGTNGSFQVEMTVLVGEINENAKLDRVVLRIDAPNVDEGHVVSDDIKDIKVDLIKYIKG